MAESVVEMGRKVMSRAQAAVDQADAVELMPLVLTLLNSVLARLDTLEGAVTRALAATNAQAEQVAVTVQAVAAQLNALNVGLTELQLAVTAPRVRRPVRADDGSIAYVVDEVGAP